MIGLAEQAQIHTWIDVALTAIAALPGVIAAVSSLKNGRTLRENGRRKSSTTLRSKKKGERGPDWYKAPDL